MLRIVVPFALLLTLVTACSPLQPASSGKAKRLENLGGRFPAAVEIEPEYESNFQNMLINQDLEEHIQLKVDQIEYAYYIGVAAAEDFDRLLASESQKAEPTQNFQKLAFENGILPRIAASEAYGQLAQDQFKYYFLRLIETSQSAEASVDTRHKVAGALDYLNRYLREVPWSTRIALNRWAEDLFTIAPNTSVLKRAYEHLFVGKPEALQAYLQDAKVQAHQKKLVAKVSIKRNQFFSGMVQSFEKYQRDQFTEEARKPQNTEPPIVSARDLPPNSLVLAFEGALHERYTQEIIDALKSTQTAASFFVSGSGVSPSSKVLQALKSEDFPIQSQSFRPLELPKLYSYELSSELNKSRRAILKMSSRNPYLLRAPFSADSIRLRSLAAKENFRLVQGNIFPLDLQDRDLGHQVSRVIQQAKLTSSGITFIHMDCPDSSQLARKVVEKMRVDVSDKHLISIEEIIK